MTEKERETKDQSQDADDGGKQSGKQQDVITLTPAQLEERLARERNKYADYKDIKSQLAALQKQEQERTDADKSEVERLTGQLSTAQAERDELRIKMHDTLIRSALEREAAKASFHDPSEAFQLADLTGVEIDDDGNVTGADVAIKALVKAKAHLVKTPDKPDIDADRGSSSKTKQRDAQIAGVRGRFGLRPKQET